MTEAPARSAHVVILIAAWLAVGVPLGWGVVQTLIKAAQLFR